MSDRFTRFSPISNVLTPAPGVTLSPMPPFEFIEGRPGAALLPRRFHETDRICTSDQRPAVSAPAGRRASPCADDADADCYANGDFYAHPDHDNDRHHDHDRNHNADDVGLRAVGPDRG